MQTRRGGKQGYRSTPWRFCSKFGGDKSPLFDRFPAFSERLDAQPPGKTQINSRIPAPRRSLPCRQLTPIPSLLRVCPLSLRVSGRVYSRKIRCEKIESYRARCEAGFSFSRHKTRMDQKNAPNVIKNTCPNDEINYIFFLETILQYHISKQFFYEICIHENFVSILIFESFSTLTFLKTFNLIKRLEKEINVKNEKRERDKIKHL